MPNQIVVGGGITWTYTYNDANRMLSATEVGGAGLTVTYVYDVLGNLLSETGANGGSTVTGYAYLPGGTLYADVGTGGTIETRYVAGVQGANTWLARVNTQGGGAWLVTDYQGSVMLVVGLTGGGVLDSIVYDANGGITSETNAAARGDVGFQGGRYDAGIGAWLFGLREEQAGRWTTMDPSGLGPDSEPYRFVGNGPTDGTDPSGLASNLYNYTMAALRVGFGLATNNPVAVANGVTSAVAPPASIPEALNDLKEQSEWLRSQKWGFPARLLEHFVNGNGKDYNASETDIKEALPHLVPMVCAMLSDYIVAHPGFVTKKGEPKWFAFDVPWHVRWIPENTSLAFKNLGGSPVIEDDYMFYAYGGALIKISGYIGDLWRQVKKNSDGGIYEAPVFDAQVHVTVTDKFNFDPPAGYKGVVSNLFAAYRAGYYLQNTGTGRPFDDTLETTLSLVRIEGKQCKAFEQPCSLLGT